MSVIQKNNPLKCVLFDKDPLGCTLRLIHMTNMNSNTGKVNVSVVSRIQAELYKMGIYFACGLQEKKRLI